MRYTYLLLTEFEVRPVSCRTIFFRLEFKAKGRGARARNPSREKLGFVNFSTDQENEIIHTFFISLGSNRGGRFQIKQTLN